MYKNASRNQQAMRDAQPKKGRTRDAPYSKFDRIASARMRLDWFAYIYACEKAGSHPFGVPDEIMKAYREKSDV